MLKATRDLALINGFPGGFQWPRLILSTRQGLILDVGLGGGKNFAVPGNVRSFALQFEASRLGV